MSSVALVMADFAQNPAGGPSQLATLLGDRPILAHTLTRLQRVAGVERRCLVTRAAEAEAAAALLEAGGLRDSVELLPLDDGRRPRRQLLCGARKWSLEAWRGGLLGATAFDEYLEPRLVAALLAHLRAEVALVLDGHMAAFDPVIADAMLAHYRDVSGEAAFVFTQAPPGLAGVLLSAQAAGDLVALNIPLGLLLGYRPELAQGDLITKPPCLHLDRVIAQTAARFVADTRRSRELLTAAFAELGADADAAELCRWLARTGFDRAGPLPVEVELELTTDDPAPQTRLRPRGRYVPTRRLERLDAIAQMAAELSSYDDRLVWLGGHGDPLEHPQFLDICRILRAAGVYGLGVETTLLGATAEQVAGLLDCGVDVVEVRLDADSAATYAAIHGNDGFDRVRGLIDEIQSARASRGCPLPILAPSLTRFSQNLPELEAFYDRWVTTCGTAVIRPYDDYGGVLPQDTLIQTHPPIRAGCRRIRSRITLLADGRVAKCSQDLAGRFAVGEWFETPLAEIWQNQPLTALRIAQKSLKFDDYPLCKSCRVWAMA